MSSRLTLLLLLLVLAAPLGLTGASPGHYHYSLKIEDANTPLVHLASFGVGQDGFYQIALDVTLIIESSPYAVKGRTMLHLIVCDTDATDRFLHNLPASGNGSRVSDAVPAYCAMANRTLADFCRSYPLTDDSANLFVYRSQKTLEGPWPFESDTVITDDRLHFYIDACETVGGAEGVLRSCLGDDKRNTQGSTDCFYCPKNFPLTTFNASSSSCIIPDRIRPTMLIQASMNLCNKDGSCLSQDAEFLSTFYLGLTITWTVIWFVWAAHIRASREAVVNLQTKMKVVPAVLCVYAGLTCAMLYTDQILEGMARKLVVNGAILSQVFALAVPAEVVILIAKGWKITRAQLEPREHQYIRFVTIVWAISFAILKHSVVKHLTVFLVWGVSWSSVVFMIWYNSAFNLNMLRYQIAMVRQMQLDPTRTPVFTKYLLFRRFRGLLGIYMFISCVIAVLGLVSDATNDRWRWSATAADEALSCALYAAIGYAFRCRRFSNLIQAPASTNADANGEPTPAPTTRPSTSAAVAPTAPTVAPRIADLPRPKSSMVLVVNPDPNDQSLGTSYLPVNPKPGKPVAKEGAATCSGGGSSPSKKNNATS